MKLQKSIYIGLKQKKSMLSQCNQLQIFKWQEMQLFFTMLHFCESAPKYVFFSPAYDLWCPAHTIGPLTVGDVQVLSNTSKTNL